MEDGMDYDRGGWEISGGETELAECTINHFKEFFLSQSQVCLLAAHSEKASHDSIFVFPSGKFEVNFFCFDRRKEIPKNIFPTYFNVKECKESYPPIIFINLLHFPMHTFN